MSLISGAEPRIRILGATFYQIFMDKRPTYTRPVDQSGKPAYDLAVERAVIGALLIEDDAILQVADILESGSFYDKLCSNVYKAIEQMFREGKPVDIITVADRMQRNGDGSGATIYSLTELTESIGSANHIRYHAMVVAQYHIMRRLTETAESLKSRSVDKTEDVLDTTQWAISQLEQLIAVEGDNMTTFGDGVRIAEAEMREAERRAQESGIPGMSYGLKTMDQATGGLKDDNLVIVGARPGMGKTAYALSMAYYAARRGEATLYFSLEMSPAELVKRCISIESSVPLEDIVNGHIGDGWKAIDEKLGYMMDCNMYIEDAAGYNIAKLVARAKLMVKKYAIKLIVVDYIQLLSFMNKAQFQNKEQEIGNMSRNLKLLARELHIPVVALVQLNRDLEKRGGDKRPTVADIRDSGSIEQDADIIEFLYRPEAYGISEYSDGTATANCLDVIIGKYRSGRCQDLRLKFEGKYTRVSDW